MAGNKSTTKIKKILRRMNAPLEGMRKAIEYLSLHMEKQKSMQEEMEAKMHEQR